MTPVLPAAAEGPIAALEEMLRSDPRAPVSAASRERAREVHIADSLSALEFAELSEAGRIGDLGSGAGLPGLVLAAAVPDARVDLIEAAAKKCEFIESAIARMGLANAGVVHARAEEWGAAPRPEDSDARGGGRGAYDALTARAVGPLASIAELGSPLLRDGAVILAWKGRRSPEEEAALERAAERVGIEPVDVRKVVPYPGSQDRHIHLLRKNGPTPEGLPRRIGLATKRPFGSE